MAMPDYINRRLALQALKSEEKFYARSKCQADAHLTQWKDGVATGLSLAQTVIEKQKDADVEPVRHGQWKSVNGGFSVRCSSCGSGEFVFSGPTAGRRWTKMDEVVKT